MNRGSQGPLIVGLERLGPSMRPRFMNRGSRGLVGTMVTPIWDLQ